MLGLFLKELSYLDNVFHKGALEISNYYTSQFKRIWNVSDGVFCITKT
jgi:hypothetical protein